MKCSGPLSGSLAVPAIGVLLCLAAPVFGQAVRERRDFDNGWRFHLGDVGHGESAALVDKDWREVDLPHDWSIEGPFDRKNASCTGFLPGGIGWYRKTFTLAASLRGRKISVRFDGVYRDSDVWINGVHLGHRPYGYSTFEYDLTPYVHFGDATNVMAVRVDHRVVADSRWYPGSGIFRNVWLIITEPVHIAPWGIYVTTPEAGQDEALVSVETRVMNEAAASCKASVVTAVVDESGRELARAKGEESVPRGGDKTFAQQVAIEKPGLWSPERPRMYALLSRIYVDGRLLDEEQTPFGIRRFYFSPDKGLVLNGEPVKMKGVCIHHDLGALGAAFFREPLERRLTSLKEIGVNAIRCSHNPMAPVLYDLCDRMGFLVMDEAFDEWIGGKRKWTEGWNAGVAERRGYHEDFERWGVRDLEDMVRRDRNHPSVILWSIGNEIDYPDDPFTHPKGRGGVKPGSLSADLMPGIARRLISALKLSDTTRPVTMALADIDASNATGVAEMLDVVGYNYQEQSYDRDHKTYPNRIIYGSENGHSPDVWRPVAQDDWVGGQFLWPGVDYLGEARRFPSHGSSSGLLDIAGFWKPGAYFRQALWSSRPMVYASAWAASAGESRMADWPKNLGRTALVERWGWTDDPRKNIPVEIYSNCDSVEVLLNGKPIGEKPVADRLLPALLWALPNESGTVEVVGKNGGTAVARFRLKPVGKAERLELRAGLNSLKEGGRQVSTVEIRAVDAAGDRVPEATPGVTVEVAGAGRLIAFGNADLNDNTPAQSKERKLYQGRAVAIVRSGARPGRITVRATAPGLAPGEITLAVEP